MCLLHVNLRLQLSFTVSVGKSLQFFYWLFSLVFTINRTDKQVACAQERGLLLVGDWGVYRKAQEKSSNDAVAAAEGRERSAEKWQGLMQRNTKFGIRTPSNIFMHCKWASLLWFLNVVLNYIGRFISSLSVRKLIRKFSACRRSSVVLLGHSNTCSYIRYNVLV